ncbi:MAG: protein-L-isoaspartate(D-aspartate) O-methyltransferase, partial [Pirellulaceae bacterium]
MTDPDPFASDRGRMLSEHLAGRGIRCPRVLSALEQVPRHQFVAAGQQHLAYQDQALGIDCGQTISQPYIVAAMSQALDLAADHLVLEIGTGSGYQAAVLSPLVNEVYTIEIVNRLGRRAERTLKKLGYENIHLRRGDGFLGWPEA